MIGAKGVALGQLRREEEVTGWVLRTCQGRLPRLRGRPQKRCWQRPERERET